MRFDTYVKTQELTEGTFLFEQQVHRELQECTYEDWCDIIDSLDDDVLTEKKEPSWVNKGIKYIQQYIKDRPQSDTAKDMKKYLATRDKDTKKDSEDSVDTKTTSGSEDDGTIRPKTIEELFQGVREIHFLSYLRYLYFNIGRIAYLQANVLSAYVFLAPAIVAGAVTLGVMQQIIRAFGRVEGSMQYILKAWPTIIELASVYKRLREFENKLENEEIEVKSKI